MAKKKPAALKKKKNGVTPFDPVLKSPFLQIVSVQSSPPNLETGQVTLTITAVCQVGTGNPTPTVAYIDSENDSTGSGTAVLSTNKNNITATITLPSDSVYYVQVSLVTGSGATSTTVASDSTIYDSEEDGLGVVPPEPNGLPIP